MTIYGEYLFLENFTAGLLLLWLTGRMAGTGQSSMRLGRILAGGFLCGVSGFLILVPLGAVEGLVVRIGLAAVITAAGLGADSFRQLVRKAAVFLILSFLAGGIAMAVFLWLQEPALWNNGAAYMQPMTWAGLILCSIPALGLSWWLVNLIRQRNRVEMTRGTAKIVLEDKCWNMEAMVDTGNCLREPLTGKPVLLTDRKGKMRMEESGFQLEKLNYRAALIPYNAVGVEHGMLEGVRLDDVDFGGRKIQGAVLAFYDGEFGEFEILLNREMLEGGILENV